MCGNVVLAKYGKPPIPWSLKAKLMGVPGSSNGDVFHAWAQLPITREEFRAELQEQQLLHFPNCEPLPGVKQLLEQLKHVYNKNGKKVHVALASSSERKNFELKTRRPETKKLFDIFIEERRILGDDPRLVKGRGKPAPEIFLLALQSINDGLPEDEEPITPAECLVFEDSVPGVEAGRRAKMRVVWVPPQGLLDEYLGREEEVLAGRTGIVPIGDDWQLGETGDGLGRILTSLEDFPYESYGLSATGQKTEKL